MATNTEKEVIADEVEEQREPTLREQLESARDEVVSRQEKENDAGSPADAHDGSSRSDRANGAAADRGDGRTAQGRFVSSTVGTDQTQTPAGAANAQEQPAVRSDPVRSPAETPAPVALPPPNGWKAEEKALWAKVPSDVQHVIQRRETDVARKIAEQDEVRLVGNNFMQAANEFAPVIQARGGNPVALFREVLGIISQIHNTDPANRAQLFRQLAAQNGADLRQLGFAQQPGAQGQPAVPSQVPIDVLVQRAVDERLTARQRAEAQERERAEMETTNREIEAFRSKIDTSGQLAYPYFNHVSGLMGSIIQSAVDAQSRQSDLPIPSLEEAYQLAVKAHPETSKLIAQAEQAAEKASEDKRQAAIKARRKAGSVHGGVGSTPSIAAGDRTIRDELKAAFEESRSRL